MLAYVLQMLFFALSVFSVVIILLMILRGLKATKRQWWALFLPFLLLFMTIAFRFPWETNANNDLSRYINDLKGLRSYGFFYEMRHADEYSWLWRALTYLFCWVENFSVFPMVTVGIEYLVFFYILSDCAERNSLSATDVSLCLILRLSLLPLIMSAAAARNTLAYSFFSLGVYMYYKYGLKNIRMYLWIIAGVLTHTTVIIGVLIFAISLLMRRYKLSFVLFLPIGILLGTVIVPTMELSTNEYVRFLTEKWDMYTNNPNSFDTVKNGMIIPGLAMIFMLFGYWYLSRNTSPNKPGVTYVLSNMAMTVGVYGVMAELFLRLCYPTSFLVPIVWAEVKRTEWKSRNAAIAFWLLMLVGVAVFFLTTGGSWFWQITWFFEL